MGEFLYNILDSYYSLLKRTGYLKDTTVYKLLVLCFYNDLVMEDFRGLISKEDYSLIEGVLDSFYGTDCLISYPDYLKMGKLHIGEVSEWAHRIKKLENTDVVKVIHDTEHAEGDINSDVSILIEEEES